MSRKKLPIGVTDSSGLPATKGQTTTAKQRMVAVADCGTQMTQPEKVRVLDLRQALISQCETILEELTQKFVHKLPDYVEHAPVFRFAKKCQGEKCASHSHPTRPSPALDFLKLALSSVGKVDVPAMEALAPVPIEKWWELLTPVSMAAHPMFTANYPDVARLFLDMCNPNYLSIVDWLEANPNPARTAAVAKSRK